MTTEVEPYAEFWGLPKLMMRILHKDYRQWLDGSRIYVQFINGYNMSILNGAGMGVETMITDADGETIARDDVPDYALPLIKERLQDDTVIAHMTPEELRDVLLDVAYWPDWSGFALLTPELEDSDG